jgi:hypothetical protein
MNDHRGTAYLNWGISEASFVTVKKHSTGFSTAEPEVSWRRFADLLGKDVCYTLKRNVSYQLFDRLRGICFTEVVVQQTKHFYSALPIAT